MQTRKTLTAIAALVMASFTASAYALTPGSGTWVKESATYGTPNLQDAYLYVPSNANPQVLDGKRALMVSLHGCGQTSSGNVINKKFNWEVMAEQYGMIVIAPTVPSGTSSTRTSSGCWDWFGANHNRTSRDAVPLIKLVDALKARSNLDIDVNQIYISGLSSGAAETHVMGCSFPDYFAAVIPNAAPALGSASTDIFSDPKRTAQQVVDTCKAINGNAYNSYFNTQLFANVYGSGDTMVKPSHNVRNRDGMKILYGANTSGGTVTVTGGGTADIWKDGNGKIRISNMSVNGMAHAWPAGPGGSGGGTYVDYTHVNFPSYIVPWLFANNMRVSACTGTGCTTTTTSIPNGTTTTTTATTPTTTVATTCYTSSNYAHVSAGRAYHSLGYAKANGSNQSMGLYNTFTINTLKKTGANYYVIGTCP